MEIDTEPVFKLPPGDVLPTDIQRCLLCQSSKTDKLVKNSSQVADILDKLHEHHETEQYSKINKRNHITGRSILNQSSYYIKCSINLGTLVNNLKRLIDKRNLQESGSNNQATLQENKRLSRSAVSVYEKDKCVFCQLDKNERLHALATDKKLKETRDSELKQALKKCSQSLAVIRIRFE